MSVNIEKVDEIRKRTGASYSLAKEALEHSEGDVLDAIVYIEKKDKQDNLSEDKKNEIISKLKELIKKGNITRVILQKNEKTILDIPVLAGAIGVAIFSSAALVGVLAALASGCKLMVLKENGEIIDINEMTGDAYHTVKDKFSNATTDNKDVSEADDEEAEDSVVESPETFNDLDK